MSESKKLGRQFRQGDVIVYDPTEIGEFVPETSGAGVSLNGSYYLTPLSVTNHVHRIEGAVGTIHTVDGSQDRVLKLEQSCKLVHGNPSNGDDRDHDMISIPAGTYVVRPQNQWSYTEEMSRQVED